MYGLFYRYLHTYVINHTCSYVIYHRFFAAWLIHCHCEYHLEQGCEVTLLVTQVPRGKKISLLYYLLWRTDISIKSLVVNLNQKLFGPVDHLPNFNSWHDMAWPQAPATRSHFDPTIYDIALPMIRTEGLASVFWYIVALFHRKLQH